LPALYTIQVSSTARKYIEKLDKPTRDRFKVKLEAIMQDPFNPANSQYLEDPTRRKARVGGYRMLLEVDVERKVVIVSDAGPRGQIYNKL
jgi:mRNA-degrading endonuclease RelE of RelBE toxin-antitoxin system